MLGESSVKLLHQTPLHVGDNREGLRGLWFVFWLWLCVLHIASVKISPHVSQKQLRFDEDVGVRKFVKLAKKYHQQHKEECASVGRIIIRAMSPPRLADIGVLLQEAEEASRA